MTKPIDFRQLDSGFRRNFRHNFFKIQYRHQIPAALGDASGHAFVAASHGFIRFLDILPGDPADAHHGMDPERDIHFVEIGDDKQILGPFFALYAQKIAGQVHHGEHNIPGPENPFHSGMGVGHMLHRRGHQDLLYLGHVDAVKVVIDCKFHHFDFIGA